VVQETDKIKEHIDAERERLTHSIGEIEHRVKNAVDVKEQFKRNTGLFLGGAVAAGFLLGRLSERSRRRPRASRFTSMNEPGEGVIESASHRLGTHLSRFSDAIDNIIGGLANVASERLYSAAGEIVPGLRDHLNVRRTETTRTIYH
jgi:hypothetical protein